MKNERLKKYLFCYIKYSAYLVRDGWLSQNNINNWYLSIQSRSDKGMYHRETTCVSRSGSNDFLIWIHNWNSSWTIQNQYTDWDPDSGNDYFQNTGFIGILHQATATADTKTGFGGMPLGFSNSWPVKTDFGGMPQGPATDSSWKLVLAGCHGL